MRDFAPARGTPRRAAGDWVDVDVPGDVHTALVEAGRIADPFYDRNENACAWMEEREWWYRVSFDDPRRRRPRSGCGSSSTGSTRSRPSISTARSSGATRTCSARPSFDVTERSCRRREPRSRSASTRRCSTRGARPEQWSSTPAERVWMRKAQFGFGWDWGPRLPTIGIWRPVELRARARATLTRRELLDARRSGATALVAVDVEAERFAGDGPLVASIELRRPAAATPAARDGDAARRARDRLPHARRPAALVDARPRRAGAARPAVTLRGGDDGRRLRERRVGMRTLALDQSPDPDEPGTRFFRFVLNGVRIFARGANWIPADSFVGAIAAARYERLIERARDANMNMLRVWGGGIYEHDVFYDICDRLGLLVWQDFMFACAMYPEDGARRGGRAEAREQVRRLRGHPCLALWCGNNENQWIHDMQFPDRGGARVPRRAVLRRDPAARGRRAGRPRTPYWPGSPFGGNDHNAREEGDAPQLGRLARPVAAALRRPGGARADARARRLHPLRRGRGALHPRVRHARRARSARRCGAGSPPTSSSTTARRWTTTTRTTRRTRATCCSSRSPACPADLDEFIDFSMIAQAEGLKFGIEHFRRRKPHCSGTLVWQLNDCWPVLSWALLDYYGFGKAGYYAVKRAFAPVLASFKDGNELWVTNDSGVRADGVAQVRLGSFGGDVLAEEQVPFSRRSAHQPLRGALRARGRARPLPVGALGRVPSQPPLLRGDQGPRA